MKMLIQRKNMVFPFAVLICVVGLVIVRANRTSIRNWFDGRVHAQTNTAAAVLGDPNGGVGPYGAAMQTSSSSAATYQAVNNWNSYVQSRSGWVMSSTSVNRLAS